MTSPKKSLKLLFLRVAAAALISASELQPEPSEAPTELAAQTSDLDEETERRRGVRAGVKETKMDQISQTGKKSMP